MSELTTSAPTLSSTESLAPPPSLSDSERSQVQRLLGFPLDLPTEFVTWMEERMRLLLTSGNVLGLDQRVVTVGSYKIIAKDLSANAGLYLYTDQQGLWLYCNGAAFAGATYPELNTFLGGVTLPDSRGRSLWFCGSNAACSLLDNDGVAEASRQPAHTHSVAALTVIGAPGIGTLGVGIGSLVATAGSLSGNIGSLAVGKGSLGVSITDPGHSHDQGYNDFAGGDAVGVPATSSGTHPSSIAGNTTGISASVTGAPTLSGAPGVSGSPTLSGAPSISGAPSVGSLDVGGTGGTGMAGSDAVAHTFIGSLLIKA